MTNFAPNSDEKDSLYMRLALAEAQKAAEKDEVPVGAVVIHGSQIIGTGHNRREELNSALAHAEISAVEEACRHQQSWRLNECDIYVTLEPCIMCVGAILQSRVRRLIFGCLDPKAGAVESLYQLCDDARLNHRLPASGGVLAADCAKLLEDFFAGLRTENETAEKRRGGRARLKAPDSKSGSPSG